LSCADEQIASIIEESWDKEAAWIEIHVDMRAVRKLQLEITLDSIKRGLVVAKLKIQEGVSHHFARMPKLTKRLSRRTKRHHE
jgi:hypothetical protein